MTFNIYEVGGIDTGATEDHREFLETCSTPQEATSFVSPWMRTKGFQEEYIDWFEEMMQLEMIQEKIIREGAEFKIIMYVNRGWSGVLVEMINDPVEEEAEPTVTMSFSAY